MPLACTSRPSPGSVRACHVTSLRAGAARPVRGDRGDRSVPADGLGVPPGAAWGVVAARDVPEAPFDLSRGVRLPVGARRGHLRTREGLRDSVGAARGVVGIDAPARLLVPQRDEAVELGRRPAARRDGAGGVGLRGSGIGGDRRRRPAGTTRRRLDARPRASSRRRSSRRCRRRPSSRPRRRPIAPPRRRSARPRPRSSTRPSRRSRDRRCSRAGSSRRRRTRRPRWQPA